MGSSLVSLGLGSGKIRQTSISEEVDQKLIESIFLKNLDKIEEYLKLVDDQFASEIFLSLKENKKINFIIFKYELKKCYFIPLTDLQMRSKCFSTSLPYRMVNRATSRSESFGEMFGRARICCNFAIEFSFSNPQTIVCSHSETSSKEFSLTSRESSPTRATCLLTVPDIFLNSG